MLKLVADSGSTKTDWALVENHKILREYQTIGLNPYLNTREMIVEIIRNELIIQFATSDIKNTRDIQFYGAGCSTEPKKKLIHDSLHCFFPFADINVEHDLLGAARSVCGNEPGIAIILGTGSNSCMYDGTKITDNLISLGYVLGDEGSGCFMGKRLVTDFLNKEMPTHLSDSLQKEFNLSKEVIFDNVYNRPRPNKYLASFTKWMDQYYGKESYVEELILDSFDRFFQKSIIKYKDYKKFPINVVGSVGFYFKKELEAIAAKYDCKLGKVIKSPLEGLV